MRFMDLPEKWTGKDSNVFILPIEYEKDVTWGTGADKGPNEILKCSYHLEPYDEQFNIDPYEEGIHLLNPLKFTDETAENAIEKISEEVCKYKDKFLISVGGDHAVSIGVVNEMEGDFSVLVLDAHADLKDSWEGSKLHHSCISKRVSEKHDIGIIGVRSMDLDEHELVDNENIRVLKSYDYTEEKVDEMISKLKDKVYLSIDVDVFDPSFIRNTGTPEPDGLQWKQVIYILQKLFEKKKVIGCDVVEFSPKYNFEAEAFALAKLIYKIVGLYKMSKTQTI